jgi:aerobic-type carbon monoxide dehydrogenase small subunit (CoxS/CutS family)
MQLRLTINAQRHELDVEPHRPLADVIRTEAALTGTKVACGEGTCGSCTVLVDGRAVACDGADVRTVEGVDDLLGRLQAAFTEEDAFQCGFCTPGQLLSAVALLRANPHPSAAEIRAGMSGNLCRCGAYPAIERAVARTAEGA